MTIVEKITMLAQNRGWKITDNRFCMVTHDSSSNDIIVIGRLGLSAYKNEYKKQLKLKTKGRLPRTIKYNGTNTLKKVDTWLVECIRYYIPEANSYTIKFSNVTNSITTTIHINKKNKILSYPPKINKPQI